MVTEAGTQGVALKNTTPFHPPANQAGKSDLVIVVVPTINSNCCEQGVVVESASAM
jgi:hypothetical protein